MGYGVIGSPTGSGPVSLGSSPGTPALSWITVLNGPSGPFSRLARAAVFRGDDPPNPPRGPASRIRLLSRRRPSSRRTPAARRPQGARRRPSSRRGWFPFLRFNFLSPRRQPDPCPHAPASPPLRVLRSVRAAPRARRPGSSPVCPRLGSHWSSCRDYHCRCSSGGKITHACRGARPANPTRPGCPSRPGLRMGGSPSRALAQPPTAPAQPTPRDPAAVSDVGAKKDPRPRGGVRERGCSGGRAGNGQAVDSSLGAAWEGEPAVPVSSRPTSDDDGSGRGRARCR